MPYLTDSITSTLHLDGVAIPLTCHLLEANLFPVPQQHTYPHPTPPFNRAFIFLSGGCLVDTGMAQYDLQPGFLHLLPAAQSFDGTFASGTELLYFHLRLEHVTGHDICHGVQGVIQLPLQQETIATLRTALHPAEMAVTMVWQSLLFHLVCCCLSQLPVQHLQMLVRGVQRQRDVLEYIQQHGTPALTIADCAEHLGVSRAALSKAFSRDMGLPLKNYLQQTFLERACQLLCHSTLTVKEVAQQIGYEDVYYFHRLFKRHIGQTPVAYRRLMGRIT